MTAGNAFVLGVSVGTINATLISVWTWRRSISRAVREAFRAGWDAGAEVHILKSLTAGFLRPMPTESRKEIPRA